jgi:tetratricopeptide (TPR) repeat protein
VLIELAEAQIQLGKTREAEPVVAQYLEAAREPYSRSRGLQAQAAVFLGKKEFDEAAELCDESLLLQPEGRLNAEGRLLSGEISFARGDYDGAARAFMTVAVLYDDSSITPRALQRAADAYRKANNEPEAEKALHELQQRFRIRRNLPRSPERINEASPFPSLTAANGLGQQPTSKNKRSPRSRGSILLPDGWHMKEEPKMESSCIKSVAKRQRAKRRSLAPV